MSFLLIPKKLDTIEVVPDPFDDIRDEVRDKILHLRKDGKFHLSNFSTELLCDYLSMDFSAFGLLEYKCMDEISDRVHAASLQEILDLFIFLGERMRFSSQYIFMIKFIMHKLLAREDRIDFFRRFYNARGFHLLNIQIDVHGFMQYSQNYKEK